LTVPGFDLVQLKSTDW